jgi:hypothetical protein
MREVGNSKPNTRTVPSGYDFGSSQDYDSLATGTSTGTGAGGGTGSGGNNTQFFDADGKWIGGTNYQAYFESLFPGGTITAEQLKAKLPELQRAGINLHTNTGGDVIKLPDGSLIDVIRDVGGANGRVWNSASGNTPPPSPPGGAGTTSAATPTETPAQRAARLATFGLGPEGLQNQRPGAPPPRPGQMGDMMGRRPGGGSGPYDPSGGRGTRGPDQGQGQSEGPMREGPLGTSPDRPYTGTGGINPGNMYGPRQGQNQPYDPSGGRGFIGPDQGGGYRPVEDPGMYTPGEAYQAPEYRAPDPYQQATPFSRDEYQAATPFAAPTAADMGQDPGYQFRLSQGQKALERSGAARGVTNTGGNMKGLLDYGQQAASQEYGNVYGRNLTTYNTNEANRAGAYQTNYGNALTAYNTNEANRAGAYNTNAANAYQQYTTNALAKNAYNQETESRRSGAFNTNSTLYQQRQQDAYNRSQQAYNDAMAEYQSGINNQRNYERDRMSDLFRVAGI